MLRQSLGFNGIRFDSPSLSFWCGRTSKSDKNGRVMPIQSWGKEVSWPILGRKLAILAKFFKIWTSNFVNFVIQIVIDRIIYSVIYTVNYHQLLNIFSINSLQFDNFCGRPLVPLTPSSRPLQANPLPLVRTSFMDDP